MVEREVGWLLSYPQLLPAGSWNVEGPWLRCVAGLFVRISLPDHPAILPALSALAVTRGLSSFFSSIAWNLCLSEFIHRRIHSVTAESPPSFSCSILTPHCMKLSDSHIFHRNRSCSRFSCLLPNHVSFFSNEHKVIDMSSRSCYHVESSLLVGCQFFAKSGSIDFRRQHPLPTLWIC